MSREPPTGGAPDHPFGRRAYDRAAAEDFARSHPHEDAEEGRSDDDDEPGADGEGDQRRDSDGQQRRDAKGEKEPGEGDRAGRGDGNDERQGPPRDEAEQDDERRGDGKQDRRGARDEERRGDQPEKRARAEEPGTEARGEGKERKAPSFLWLGVGLGVAVVIGVVLAVVLYVHHHHQLRAEAQRRQEEVAAGPKIVVATVHKVDAVRELTLPADVRAFFQTTLYAKVSGFVKSIRVDKGDVVHAGDVIAQLETPEVAQQVAGAAADVVAKRKTLARYAKLRQQDFVSAEDLDTAQSQYGVSVAALRQNEALHDYRIIRAPFDGTITARYTNPGALIPAGTGSTSGAMPIVDLAQLDKLRVTVFVQQDAAAFIQVGDPVTLTVDEQPQMKIEASVSRIARALDPRSRAMLCEIWLMNDHKIYPGTFMHAKLRLHAPSLPTIPTGAVMVREGRTLVAQVKDDRIQLVPVEVGLDDGRMVQVVSGLKEGDQVGVDVPSELAEGAKVRPIPWKDAGAGKGGDSAGNAAGAASQPDHAGAHPTSAGGGEGAKGKGKAAGPEPGR